MLQLTHSQTWHVSPEYNHSRQTAVSVAASAVHAEQETSPRDCSGCNHFAFWGAAQQSCFVGLFQTSLDAMAPDAKAMSLPRVLHDLTQILQSSSMEESTGTATQGEVAPRVRQMLLRLMQCCATLDNGKQGAFNSCQGSAYQRKRSAVPGTAGGRSGAIVEHAVLSMPSALGWPPWLCRQAA